MSQDHKSNRYITRKIQTINGNADDTKVENGWDTLLRYFYEKSNYKTKLSITANSMNKVNLSKKNNMHVPAPGIIASLVSTRPILAALAEKKKIHNIMGGNEELKIERKNERKS